MKAKLNWKIRNELYGIQAGTDGIYMFGGTGDEITAMREGWLTASVLRPIDDSGVGVADAFVAHSKGEKVPQSWSGPFKMIDKWSDADEIVNYSNRYSKPKMGR